MNVHAPETDVKPVRPGDCGCGCGGQCGCESRCCDLECLVRPNFFCGQVLTDADLDAMVEWARKRFSLTRYRHGWGVVCGLEVTCTHPRGKDDCCPEPRGGPTVYVNPGYAIDCCGNDLVVCEPLAVDLGKVCRPIDDPCERPRKPKAPGSQTPVGQPAPTVRQPASDPDDCWDSIGGDLVAVNLRLRYHEDLAQGQRAMFRGACSDAGSCEYARVLEHPCVHAELGTLDCDPDDDSQLWEREFTIRRTRAKTEIEHAIKGGADGVLRYLRRYPPYKFCFLDELVCCFWDLEYPKGEKGREQQRQQRQQPQQPQRVVWGDRFAFWLYLDWLLRELECPCWSCKPDEGVPLARVLLKRLEGRDGPTCRVVMIDTSVPHRRPLRKDACRPIPRGAIDLAPYLWQPAKYVSERLLAQGVRVLGLPAKSEAELQTLLEAGRLWFDLSDNRLLHASSVRDPFGCERVVAFDTADV